MKPPTLRVLLNFGGKMPDDTTITFTRNILALLYVQAFITNPPVPEAVYEGGINAFADSKAAQPNSGKAGTALKNNKRAELDAMTKSLALYVQENCGNNLALLLSTGFQAVSNNRSSYALEKPAVKRIITGMTGEALVTMSTQSISRGCELRVTEIGPDGTPGEFRMVPFSTTSRNIRVTPLVPGVLYGYQGRNVGGSTTYSDWSDLIVQRAA